MKVRWCGHVAGNEDGRQCEALSGSTGRPGAVLGELLTRKVDADMTNTAIATNPRSYKGNNEMVLPGYEPVSDDATAAVGTYCIFTYIVQCPWWQW